VGDIDLKPYTGVKGCMDDQAKVAETGSNILGYPIMLQTRHNPSPQLKPSISFPLVSNQARSLNYWRVTQGS
jgi:hypothetical protein